MNREIFLLAGEASGDLRGAELILALRKIDPTLKFSGMGGPRMKAAGMEILADITEMAVVGVIEVLKNYNFFKKTMDRLLDEICHRKPSVVIGVDYPGFNLRLLKKVREHVSSSKLVQFISPQLWAWKESRKWQMARYLDLVLCLFPFETEVYRETKLRAVFIGHPIVERPFAGEDNRKKDLVALFPGSREKEIRNHTPVFREVQDSFSKNQSVRFVYAASGPKSKDLIKDLDPNAKFATADELQLSATVGIVCSGTATLEAAMAGLPMCVVYKVSWPTYWMGKALIKVPYLAMPNILAGKKIVDEFIQNEMKAENLSASLTSFLDNPAKRESVRDEYQKIRQDLFKENASNLAAQEILKLTSH